GRNALAGAVIIRTQDPTWDWTGKARAFVQGSDIGGAYTVSAAGGGPIINDVLAFRVAVERSEDNGFVRNPLKGGVRADFNDTWRARAKFLGEPNDGSRSLSTSAYSDAKVAAAVSDRQSIGANGYVNRGAVVAGSESLRRSMTNVPDYNHNKGYYASW